MAAGTFAFPEQAASGEQRPQPVNEKCQSIWDFSLAIGKENQWGPLKEHVCAEVVADLVSCS